MMKMKFAIVKENPMNRRNFLAASVLSICAGTGLVTGGATAFATKQGNAMVAGGPAMTPPRQKQPVLRQVLLFSTHQQRVRAVEWSPDGMLIASGADDASLLLWTPDGQVRQQLFHPASVAALAWSPGGMRLASGSGAVMRFFDGQSGRLLAPPRIAHTDTITSLAWSSSPGHPVLSGGRDMRAIVWDTQRYQPAATFTRHTTAIDALAAMRNTTTVASSSEGGAIRVWKSDTLQEYHGFFLDVQLPIRAVSFLQEKNRLGAGGDDGLVRVWANGIACQHSTVTPQGSQCTDPPIRFRAHTHAIRTLAWSPDGQYLASGGDDGVLAVWSFNELLQPSLVALANHAQPVLALSWSPTAHAQLAVASGNHVLVWVLVG